jgi:hypothetical protein
MRRRDFISVFGSAAAAPYSLSSLCQFEGTAPAGAGAG